MEAGQSDRVSIRSGHGVGKTAFFSWLAWWFLTTRRTCKVPIISPSQNQLRDAMWPEIAKWHQRMPAGLRDQYEVLGETVIYKADPKGSFIVARTAPTHKPEALQGFHQEQLTETEDGTLISVSNMMILLDEASGIDEPFFEVSRGALSGKGTKVVMAGNPTRTSGTFFDSHNKLRALYKTFHVSCLDVPRAQGHIEEVKEQYGENSNAWRVRVLGEFPTSDDETIIPLEMVLQAVDRDVDTPPYYPVWGLDVARFGMDRTALAKRCANRLLEPVKFWNNLDGTQVLGKLKQEYEDTAPDYRPSEIMVDAIGMGATVYDFCKAAGLPVRAVNVGEAASSRENCMRLRDELWFKGREWFLDRSCTIPNDEALIAELTQPLYTFTVTGKMVVERKEDMKKRGIRSPDLADAFLLTFACGIKKKIDRHRDATYGQDGTSAWSA